MVNQIFFLTQSEHNKGLPSLIFLVLAITVYLLIIAGGRVLSFIALMKSKPITVHKKHTFASSSFVRVSGLVAGLFYLVGSNITDVSILFGCGSSCIEAINDVSTILQAISLVLFAIIEIHSGKIHQFIKVFTNTLVSDSAITTEWLIWVKTAEIIAFSRIFDEAFSTIADLPTDEEEVCLTHENFTIWFMYVLLLLMWAILIGIIMIPGTVLAIRNKNTLQFSLCLAISIAVFLFLAFLLIGNNNEPLGCVFSCDVFNENITATCDQNGFHGTRISLSTLSLILISILCTGLAIHWLKFTLKLKKQTEICDEQI